MDRWYMVFDEYPHGNRDIPFYFLRNLYVEFILGKHVNYFDGLSYKDIKNLKITKDQLFSLFQDPSTGLVPPINRAHISIDWCVEPNIKAN